MGHEQVTRQILGNVPAWLVLSFYAAAFAACGLATFAFLRRFASYRCAREPAGEAPRLVSGAGAVVAYLALHRQLRRDPYAGVAHLLTFYGFFILFLGTCLVFLEYDTPLHFFYGRFYRVASLVVDLGGVAFVAGLAMFLARRHGASAPRLLRRWWVAAMSWLLLAIGLTGFALEGARIAEHLPAFERWSAVGYAIAALLRGVGVEGASAASLHRALWAGHAALCVAFFALLPWRFFGHLVYGAASWATRARRPLSRLRAPTGAPGAVAAGDFGWRDLLQADACTTCGRCDAVCPATAAGKPLRPRDVVLGLRRALDQGRPVTDFVSDDALWACTTCGACNQACPVGIEVYDKIVDLRRGRVESGRVPVPAEDLFESIAAHGNPFDQRSGERMDWAAGLDVPVARPGERVDLLLWVGCAGAFDPAGRSASRALVRVLQRLGVDYRVLGPAESCTGDPARRLGEEGLFRQQAQAVGARLSEHGVRRILTSCAHCYNHFANEAAPGLAVEVEHHSQLLARELAAGRLALPARISRTVTFHDPCYLGRGNGQTEAPRDLLRHLPGVDLREMPRRKAEGFCCGGGGGSLWLDAPGATRVEGLRSAEAAATGAAVIATGCPFCKSMLTAGCQSLPGRAPQVKDLAELVAEAEGLSP